MARCAITSQVVEMDTDTVGELSMTVELVNSGGYFDVDQVANLKKTFTSVAGAFSFSLLPTEDMAANAHYKFTWNSGTGKIIWRKTIPTATATSTLKELPDYTG
jgi:hypothetical protein